MHQTRPCAFKYAIPFFGLLIASLSIDAQEMLTVEQALNKCKNTYPSQFESKKRLACFDSISTPAIEVGAAETHANHTSTLNSGLATKNVAEGTPIVH